MIPSRYHHAICTMIVVLTVAEGVTGCTSASWNTDYHLRSWERFRLSAEKSFLKRKYPDAECQYILAIDEAREIDESPPFHLGISLVDLGRCYAADKHPQTRQVLTDAVAVIEPAVNKEGASITNELLLQNLAKAKMILGKISLGEGDLVQAQQQYQEALDLLDHCRKYDNNSFTDNMVGQDTATILYKLALISAKTGHTTDAKKYFEQALLVSRNSAGTFNTTQKIIADYCALLKSSGDAQKAADFNSGKAWIYLTVQAEKYLDLEDSVNGEAWHKKALIEARKPGQNPLNQALTLRSLARIYYVSRRFEQCDEASLAGLKIAENSTSGNDFVADELLQRLIGSYCAEGNYQAAPAVIKRLLALRQRTFGSQSLKAMQFHIQLAFLYNKLGDKTEAAKESQIAFAAFGHARPWRYKFVLDMEQLADVLMDQEKFQEAYVIVADALNMHSGAMRYKVVFRVQLLWRFYFLGKLLNPGLDCHERLEKALSETIVLNAKEQNMIKKLLGKLAGQFEKNKMLPEAQILRTTAASLPRS